MRARVRLLTRRGARAGVALIPEDRASEGLCMSLTIRDNLLLCNLPRFLGRASSAPRMRGLIRQAVSQLNVAMRRPRQEVAALSGGNQQKVILGRVLAQHP